MILFQAQFGITQPPGASFAVTMPENTGEFGLALVDGAVLIILGVALIFLVRLWFRRRNLMPVAFRKAVLLVTVPREGSDEAEKQETIEEIRQQIAVAEGWLSTLGGLRAQKGFKAWLFGRADHFSFEIVAHQGLVSFYVVVPTFMRGFMEQQLQAQYPEANVTEVGDYNIFSPNAIVLSSYLKFSRSFMFPIKTYKAMSSDPLNAQTNALSNVTGTDGVAIQIIARSAKKKWHTIGSRVARQLQQGKTLAEAQASVKTFSLFKFISSWQGKPKTQLDRERQQQSQHGPSPMEQELIKQLEEKSSKAGLDCNIRIVVSAQTEAAATQHLNSVVDSYSQYNFYQYGNSFKSYRESPRKLVRDFIYRNYRDDQKLICNTEELASLFHFPTPYLDTPNIRWLLAKKLAPPSDLPDRGLLLGENIYRGVRRPVYLSDGDRMRHQYIIGMTGTGKSVLMSNLAIQDIKDGKGVCVIDPHGSLVETILESIPPERVEDVVYFNPSDTERPIGLNMLDAQTPEQQDFAIQEMISIFYKLVTDPSMIGPLFEHNMRNAMLTLMADRENPGTIVEIPRIFTDRAFQRYKVGKVTDPMVRAFWEQEMAKTSDFHKSEMLGYLISKVGRFVENAMMRNIIGQPQSGFDFRKIMDEGKILLVNLSKGTTGEVNSNLLGLIIVSKLQMAALARSNVPENQRRDFYLYIDEFQNFITDSIATILAEARKYKLGLVLAHQYLGQLTAGTGVEGKSYGDKIRDAVFGNVGTMVSFRIGVEDAEQMEKQFEPAVSQYDLMNIERYNAYLRLLIDSSPTRAFTIHTFPPQVGNPDIAEEIRELSRWKYGRLRKEVETDIYIRSRFGETAAAATLPIEPSR